MSIQLTKSQYTAGVQCPKRLWMLIHQQELAAPPDADLQLRFEQGRELGELARKRFPEGVLVKETGSALLRAIDSTKMHLEELKVPAIFEAAFKFQDFVVRVDLLKNNFDGTWDLIEVKATSEPMPEHLDDIAFQLWVLRSSGLKVRKVYLSHINTEVAYPHLEDFFVDQDFTDAAFLKSLEVEDRVRSLVRILERNESAPEILIGRQCANPYTCEFKAQCWKEVPKGSTLELYNYRKRKPTKFELYHRGSKLISQLTDEIELTRFQQIQYLASKTERPIVDLSGLAELLGQVRYPLYYFDFETIAPAIPFLDGMRGFQRIPVQFSCHIQKGFGMELEHHEFLASGRKEKDPRQECIEAMRNLFQVPGTIIAYHDSFERSLIRELAESFLEHRDFLLEIEQTFWDLEKVFQNYFYHKNFGGSVSIKKVLPYFCPEMRYDKLNIKNGGQAQAELTRILCKEMGTLERERIREDLLTYCAQDSMAMVVIHQELLKLIGANVRFLSRASSAERVQEAF